jgi:hypothetical protein
VVDGAFAALADSLNGDVPARVAVVQAEAIRHVSVVGVFATLFGSAIDRYTAFPFHALSTVTP